MFESKEVGYLPPLKGRWAISGAWFAHGRAGRRDWRPKGDKGDCKRAKVSKLLFIVAPERPAWPFTNEDHREDCRKIAYYEKAV